MNTIWEASNGEFAAVRAAFLRDESGWLKMDFSWSVKLPDCHSGNFMVQIHVFLTQKCTKHVYSLYTQMP